MDGKKESLFCRSCDHGSLSGKQKAKHRRQLPGGSCLASFVAPFGRTWCNHIVLDFLAAHPATLGRGYGGIGTALLYSVAEVAGKIGAPLVWGEATALSAPFYRRVLSRADILDHFFISDAALAKMRGELYLRSQTSKL